MFCSKCGTQLPEDSVYCTNCGDKIIKGNMKAQSKTKLSRVNIIVIVAILCISVIVVTWLLIDQSGKANLQKQFLRDWENVEVEDGACYTLVLDFSEDEIEYRFESVFYDTEIATYKYNIISKNQFKINKRDTVNNDKSMMTITPALTSTDSSEDWFCFED